MPQTQSFKPWCSCNDYFVMKKAFCAEDSKCKMILKIGNPEALEQPYQIIRLYLKLSEPIQSTRRL